MEEVRWMMDDGRWMMEDGNNKALPFWRGFINYLSFLGSGFCFLTSVAL